MNPYHTYYLLSLIYALLLSWPIQFLQAYCDVPRLQYATGVPVALVIGNRDYHTGTLSQHPMNDATDMAKLLKNMGFEVISKKNLNYHELNSATLKFTDCLKKQQSVGVFYFSGYGTQALDRQGKKANYLLQIDNTHLLDEENVKYQAFPVQMLLDRLKKANNEINIIILDANRQYPYRHFKPLATDIFYNGNWIIAYPSNADQIPIEQSYRNNSLYVKHLRKGLQAAIDESLSIEDLFRQITQAVLEESGGQQQPHFQSSIKKDFCFWVCPEPEVLLIVRSDQQGEGASVFINRRHHGFIQNGQIALKLKQSVYKIQLKKQFGRTTRTVQKTIQLKKQDELSIPLGGGSASMVTVRPKYPDQIQKISCVALSPNGRYALFGGNSRTLWRWDLQSGKLQALLGHTDIISSVTFSPQGRYALSGSRDRTVRLWDIEQGRLKHTYRGHSGLVSSVRFSSADYALSGSYDKTMRLWNNQSQTFEQRFRGNSDWVLSVAFSPNGQTVLSGSRDHKMRLWDINGSQVRTFWGQAYIHSVNFLDGQRIVSGNGDGTVQIWDINSGRVSQTLRGHRDAVFSVDVSQEGRLVSGSLDNTLRLWDTNTGQTLQTFKGHTDDVYAVSFSHDGHRILSGGNDGLILWQSETGEPIARLMVFQDSEWAIVIPEGYFMASDNGGQKLSIHLSGIKLNNNASFNNPESVKAKMSGND
ncbi:MAG: hypothetical protein DRR16_03840 [Candidatus Parabeggiatoa sp. nov. 3]|nr:MAG: hypothetical protein DRR00_05655 [Gammaproteobacteria bacterium]RKZ88904.1 MAG: hypothetical protein DRR16_03840 [Gammaproteobacteria bacterium]